MSNRDNQEDIEELEDEDSLEESDSRGSGRRAGSASGKRLRRKRTQYCPDGRCFDYKDIETLRRFISDTGKIKPRRQTGACARCQRQLAVEIKRARHLALLPFVNVTDN